MIENKSKSILIVYNLLQDIQFKVQRHQQQVMYRTNIRHDCPWKLHQVQDAGNHLRQAILQIEKIDKETIFKYLYFVFYILLLSGDMTGPFTPP